MERAAKLVFCLQNVGQQTVKFVWEADMPLRMNISRRVSITSLMIIMLLAACGGPSTGNVSPAINLTDMNNTAQSAAATSFARTMAPTATATVTPTNTPKPTPTALPFMALDGLRAVSTSSDGNLYVRDSGKSAIQLAQDVKAGQYDRLPLISEDGEKIIFYRAGESNLDSLYAINADGTGEQALVTSERLAAFGEAYDDVWTRLFSLAFVPGTHLLLFNTYDDMQENYPGRPYAGDDLFIINTDTGKLKQLRGRGQGGNFLVSPDGKWIAIQTLDHIDVIDTQGQMVYQNLVTYDKTEAHVVIPMHWTLDSKELIILPSEIPESSGGDSFVRSIWRYAVNGGMRTEIKLTPEVVFNYYSISPDGNWIAYSYDMAYLNPQTTNGVYLGNLRDGSSQLLYTPQPNENTALVDVPLYYDGWSPDSVSFIVHNGSFRLFMGSIHGEIVPMGSSRGIEISGWIDNKRFLRRDGVLYEVGRQELVQVVYGLDTFVFLGH
jgi:Tol biopolymer transport system component